MVGIQRMNNPKILLHPARGFELVFAQSPSEFTGLNSRDRKRVHFQWCMGSVSLPGPPCHHLQSKPQLTLPACWKEIDTLKGPPTSIVEKQNLDFLYSYNLGPCPPLGQWAEARERWSPGKRPGQSAWPAGTVLQRGSWSKPAIGWARVEETSCKLGSHVLWAEKHEKGDATAEERQEQMGGLDSQEAVWGLVREHFLSPMPPFWHGICVPVIFPGLKKSWCYVGRCSKKRNKVSRKEAPGIGVRT